MNKMNLFALLVVFGLLANLAFSLPQQRVKRSPDDDWEDTWDGYSDAQKIQSAVSTLRRAGWRESCISKCHFSRAFRTSESESESADFSKVRVRKFRTLKTLRTRTQRVCLFTHLYCKEVNISQKKSEISIFSFLKSYYSLYKPRAQISTIVKTS
jgi:hypothetical protein